MSAPFKTYRVYHYDGSMTLTGDLVDARSDDEAIALAQANARGSKCEIWDGQRLVSQFPAEQRAG